MADKLDLCPLFNQQLQQLFLTARILENMIPKDGPSPCPHLYYPSRELFVKHLFWHLRQKPDDLGHHNHALGTLLVRHCLCGCCRNTIISHAKWSVILCSGESIIATPRDYVSRGGRAGLRRALLYRLLEHRQFPKVMMKIWMKSMPVFKSFCDSLKRILQYGLRDEPAVVSMLVDYLDVVNLTVKYWEKHHVLYFLENHLNTIIQVINSHPPPLNAKCVWSVARDGIPHVIRKVILRSKQFGIIGLPMMVKCEGHKAWLQVIRDLERQSAPCSSLQCGKAQRDSEDPLKLCGGCKLTYYCCRSCQKRAWPQHKSLCLKLRRLYAL